MTVLTVALMAPTVEAAQTYTSVGAGSSSCGAWTTHRPAYRPGQPMTADGQYPLQHMQWVFGFLSGIGFMSTKGEDPLRGIDPDGVLAWIDNYCRTHPIERIGDAATAFYRAHPR